MSQMRVRAGGRSGDGAPARARIGRIGTGFAAAGLVAIGVGTFLPWLRSGAVLRDSYQSIGVIRTIRAVDGTPLEPVLDAWTMTVPMITLCFVAYAVGFRRTAATIAANLAIICGTVSAFAAVEAASEDASLGVAGTGPLVVVIGGVLALLGVAGFVAGRRASATITAGGES